MYAPTLSQLSRILRYDAATGELHWLDPNRAGRPNNARSTRAGYLKGATRYIRAGGEDYRASAIAWAFVHGAWPPSYVWTLNGYPDDLRADNLTLQRTDRAAQVDLWEGLQRALIKFNVARAKLFLPPVPWNVAAGQDTPFEALAADPLAYDRRPLRAEPYGVKAREADRAKDFGDAEPTQTPAPQPQPEDDDSCLF